MKISGTSDEILAFVSIASKHELDNLVDVATVFHGPDTAAYDVHFLGKSVDIIVEA